LSCNAIKARVNTYCPSRDADMVQEQSPGGTGLECSAAIMTNDTFHAQLSVCLVAALNVA